MRRASLRCQFVICMFRSTSILKMRASLVLSAFVALLCTAACSPVLNTTAEHTPTILVTGANRGLGKEMSRILALEGNRVIMTCRDPALCEEAAQEIRESTDGLVDVLVLDVTVDEDIEDVAEAVEQNYDGEIDVLINNAGIFIERYENRSEWTEEDFNATLDTNFKGAVDVTLALAPYLAPNSTVLMVSSGFSRRRFLVDPFYLECVNNATTLKELYTGCKVFKPESSIQDQTGPAYKISKVMLNRGVEILADPLLALDGIRVVAGNPGTTNTRMAPGAKKTVTEGAESLLWIVRRGLEDPMDTSFSGEHYDQDEQELEW